MQYLQHRPQSAALSRFVFFGAEHTIKYEEANNKNEKTVEHTTENDSRGLK